MTLTGSPAVNGVDHKDFGIAGRSVSAALVVALMVFGGVACGSDGAASGSDGAASGGNDAASGSGGAAIDVLLSEWVLEPDPILTDGGEVTFTGDNQGRVVHELVVVRGESASDLFAEDETGLTPRDVAARMEAILAVVESELAAGAVVGEVEDIAPGSSKDLTVDLDAGSYVLFCNLVSSASEGPEMEGRGHFQEGMYAEFTVG